MPPELRERLAGWRADVLDFARELISVPSPNPPGDESAVAELVTRRLRSLGIEEVHVLSGESRRPNLVVDVSGATSGPTLILSGHLDTKPVGDRSAWSTDPFDPVLEDENLIGLGSGDMKAAIAAMVYAAAALNDSVLPSGTLRLVFTADEEAGSVLGSKWLADNGHIDGDVAIIGEPSGLTREWQSIHLVSRGAALFKVRVHGTQMHSSITDRLPAINASVKTANLMVRMDRELKDYLKYEPHDLVETGPTVNVGVMMSGGVFYGVCPGYAEFACDVRTLPGMSEEDMIMSVQRLLDDAMVEDPDLKAELDFEVWVPATEISPDLPIVGSLLWASSEVLSSVPTLDAFPGATDAPHFQLTAGVPTVAAFGPGLLPRAHSPNEFLASDSVGHAMEIYAIAAYDFLNQVNNEGE